MKYSADGKVSFDEASHVYTLLSTGKVLRSVTRIVNDYKEIFDSETVSFNYAQKNGLNQQEVLKAWKKEGDDSRDRGHTVHKVVEDYTNTGEITLVSEPKAKPAIKFINDFFQSGRLTPIGSEIIVHNEHIAGQIDCLAKNKNEDRFIFDWKTNKKIDKESFRGKKMTPPFSALMDCNYFHYALQLSLYRMLCKEKIKDCYLVHFREKDYKIYLLPFIQIPNVILN